MSQDQRGPDQVPIAALPPVFAHVDIAEHYQEGRFSSRLEAEIADILWNSQPVEEPERGRPVALTDETLSVLHDLNCITLIQAGQVLSLLDIEAISTPRMAIERAQIYLSAARTLLDIVAAMLEEGENRQ